MRAEVRAKLTLPKISPWRTPRDAIKFLEAKGKMDNIDRLGVMFGQEIDIDEGFSRSELDEEDERAREYEDRRETRH
jgi:hypothetical protein